MKRIHLFDNLLFAFVSLLFIFQFLNLSFLGETCEETIGLDDVIESRKIDFGTMCSTVNSHFWFQNIRNRKIKLAIQSNFLCKDVPVSQPMPKLGGRPAFHFDGLGGLIRLHK